MAGGGFTEATGDYAVALGNTARANGESAVALGFVTRADGSRSFAVGSGSYAIGDRSVAMGDGTNALGFASTSMGKNTSASSAFETVIGVFNSTYVPASATTFNENDRLFVIGNGETISTRSDAMVVLKNGNVGIGTSTPDTKLTISGVPNKTVGLSLEGGSSYLGFDGWEIGKALNEPSPVINGDLVIRNFGTPRFNMWNGYFAPSTDNNASLGLFNQRWNIIYAGNGTINTSDAREKKNIKKLDYGLETLMELNPVSYEWKEDNMNMGTKIGFIAQELLEIIPEVVVTEKRVENRETGEVSFEEAERMGVFYDDLIPVLTKAIQEQQGQIEQVLEENAELKKENEDLRNDVNDLLESMQRFEQDLQTCCFDSQSGREPGTNSTLGIDAELGQNIPNPFSESTIIRYYLPEGTTNAIIRITDMGGSPIQDLQLGATRGANQVEFQTQGFAAGTYLYSLFVDGKFVDTKKMIIVK